MENYYHDSILVIILPFKIYNEKKTDLKWQSLFFPVTRTVIENGH